MDKRSEGMEGLAQLVKKGKEKKTEGGQEGG